MRARRVLAGVVLSALLLAGCTTGARASDAAAATVRDARSAVASLALALRLHQSGSATAEVAATSLEEALDAVGTAERDLLTAGDVEPPRRARAAAAIGAAVATLTPLAGRPVSDLTPDDLARVEGAEATLAGAAQELRA